MAGYSGTPLAKKLGLRQGARAYLLDAPASLTELFAGLMLQSTLQGPLEYIHIFSRERDALAALFPRIDQALVDEGIAWISWPKRASRVATTLDEATVRSIGLMTSLVDIKVAAIDEIWSGLKFMRRRERRGTSP